MKSNLRFSSNQHLKHAVQFKTLYENGYKISGNGYTAFFLPSAFPESRIGISVSKRYGNAVFRNRHKRRIREQFRQHQPGFRRPLDIVIALHYNLPRPEWQRAELIRIFEWLANFDFSLESST